MQSLLKTCLSVVRSWKPPSSHSTQVIALGDISDPAFIYEFQSQKSDGRGFMSIVINWWNPLLSDRGVWWRSMDQKLLERPLLLYM